MKTLTVFALAWVIGCGGGDKKDPTDPSNPPDNTATTTTTATTKPPPVATATATAPPNDGQQHLPPGFGGASYDRENTEVQIRRADRQVKEHCGAATDDTGKANGPWGKVTIKLVMGRNGRVKSVDVPAPYNTKPVGKCVVSAFNNVIFAPFSGDDTSINWEVTLEPPSTSEGFKVK